MVEKVFEWFEDPVNIEWLKSHLAFFILIAAGLILLVWFVWYLSSKRRRQHLRFHLHHMAYSLGLRRLISRHWISRTHVHECFDPLVDFLPHRHIIFNEDTIENPNLIRKKVLFKLYKIADRLPKGINLLVFKTFTSRASISEVWGKALGEVEAENPGIGRHEAIRLARFKARDPKDSMGGHETGGAVDVALCDDNGEMFDYGTKYHEFNDMTFTKNHKLTPVQRKNRRRLVRMMRSYGFVNFPAEWWHFSYGDRSWAAYKGKRHGGIYGAAESDMEGRYSFTVPVNRSIHESRHR